MEDHLSSKRLAAMSIKMASVWDMLKSWALLNTAAMTMMNTRSITLWVSGQGCVEGTLSAKLTLSQRTLLSTLKMALKSKRALKVSTIPNTRPTTSFSKTTKASMNGLNMVSDIKFSSHNRYAKSTLLHIRQRSLLGHLRQRSSTR